LSYGGAAQKSVAELRPTPRPRCPFGGALEKPICEVLRK